MGEQLANGGLRWKDEKHKDTLSIWRAFWASPDSAGWFWAHWMQLMVPFFPHLDNAACYGVKKWLKKKQTKSLPANAGAVGWIPGSGRSPGEGNGSPLQCSCLENPRDGGACWAAVCGVAQSRTRLSDLVVVVVGLGDGEHFWAIKHFLKVCTFYKVYF